MRKLCLTILGLIACFSEGQLFSMVESEENCSQNLILSYFPPSIVNEVLGEYRIPEELWPSINADLSSQDEIVVSIVEDKASKINPNPLFDSKQKDVAVGIYRQTLYKVFADIMKKHGIDRREQIEAMLDEIQYKKGKLYKDCMDKKQKMLELAPDQ